MQRGDGEGRREVGVWGRGVIVFCNVDENDGGERGGGRGGGGEGREGGGGGGGGVGGGGRGGGGYLMLTSGVLHVNSSLSQKIIVPSLVLSLKRALVTGCLVGTLLPVSGYGLDL